MEVTRGSRDLILEFWDPLGFSGTVEGRYSQFGMQMHPVSYYKEKIKNRSKGSCKGHVAYF